MKDVTLHLGAYEVSYGRIRAGVTTGYQRAAGGFSLTHISAVVVGRRYDWVGNMITSPVDAPSCRAASLTHTRRSRTLV